MTDWIDQVLDFLWDMVTIPLSLMGTILVVVGAAIVILGPLCLATYLCSQSSLWYLPFLFLSIGWAGAIVQRMKND